jgi:hypothetical protein
MAYGFRHSTLILIPLNSGAISDRFLYPRDLEHVSFPWDTFYNSSIQASKQKFYFSASWDLKNNNIEGKWATRAWARRAAFKSTTILHFLSDDIGV